MFARVFVLTLCAGLIACRGENTFKRESDPYSNYNSVTENARPYNSRELQRQAARREQERQKPCGNPFVMSIEGERGKAAAFVEGRERTIVIRVQSQLEAGRQWAARVVESPCTDCVKQVSQSQAESVLSFTWTPPQGSSETPDGNFLVLRYEWPVESRCAATPITDTITLTVKKNDNRPAITFPGLRPSIKFGESFKFQVQVSDPAGATDFDLSFAPVKTAGGGVNGRRAVDCTKTGRTVQSADGQTSVVFDCSFESRRLGQDVVNAFSGSGKTAEALIGVRAQSRENKQAGESGVASVKVLFETLKGQGE